MLIDDNRVIHCSALLNQVHRGNRWDPNSGALIARYTKLHPQFWISLHVFSYDKVRYGTLHWGKYYEKALSRAFVSVLDAEEKSLVIDVGGNIGWFSLLSAAMGAEVHVFEPNVVNVHRLCESICLNGWETCDSMGSLHSAPKGGGSIQIRALGLKDEAGEFWLSQTPGSFSPGAGKLDTKKSYNSSIRVQVATLDQMATRLNWLDRDIAILKVDVEGLEHEVFQGGHALIQSGKVRNIFMEGNLRTSNQIANFQDMCRKFAEAGYVVHKLGGSIGPANDVADLPFTDQTHHSNFTASLLWGCRGYKKQNRAQCNIWWKLKKEQKPFLS